jgi:hypothetical protein
LLSIPSHPSILNITSAVITARLYLIAHSTRTITTPRAMTGRQKKQGNQFSHSKKLVQEQSEMKKTNTQIQTATK